MNGINADQIQQIAAWLAATDIAQLELRGPGLALLLQHDGAGVAIVQSDGSAVPAVADPEIVTVAAASVGVFLQAHPLRADSLAAPGTRVEAGELLGLLQIGPLLLPVPAPAGATVHEWLVADGTTVGYGTELVSLRDTAAT